MQDDTEAERYFRLAAAQGVAGAKQNLAAMTSAPPFSFGLTLLQLAGLALLVLGGLGLWDRSRSWSSYSMWLMLGGLFLEGIHGALTRNRASPKKA